MVGDAWGLSTSGREGMAELMRCAARGIVVTAIACNTRCSPSGPTEVGFDHLRISPTRDVPMTACLSSIFYVALIFLANLIGSTYRSSACMSDRIPLTKATSITDYGTVTPGIITIAKYYFSENKTIDPGLILEPRVNR